MSDTPPIPPHAPVRWPAPEDVRLSVADLCLATEEGAQAAQLAHALVSMLYATTTDQHHGDLLGTAASRLEQSAEHLRAAHQALAALSRKLS